MHRVQKKGVRHEPTGRRLASMALISLVHRGLPRQALLADVVLELPLPHALQSFSWPSLCLMCRVLSLAFGPEASTQVEFYQTWLEHCSFTGKQT